MRSIQESPVSNPEDPIKKIYPVRGIEEFESRMAHAPGFRKKCGRPFVVLSYAQSLDGSIATFDRTPLALSCREAHLMTHRIRARCDSILVGIGTVLADDPHLTVRLVEGRNPQPIVLDTNLRTPLDSSLLKRRDMHVWIVNSNGRAGKYPEKSEALVKSGALLMPCATGPHGGINLHALMELLESRGVNLLMVEGGAEVITRFLNAGLVDLLVITIAPELIGGLNMICQPVYERADRMRLENIFYETVGSDLVVWARPVWDCQE